jgi:type IV pilus assembly protein PilP
MYWIGCIFQKFSKKFHIGIIIILFWGCFFVFLGGCKQAPPPPPPSKVEKTEPPPPTEQPAEEMEDEKEKSPEYAYDPSGRREPFKTLILEEIPDVPDIILTPDPEVVKTPLQKFDVNQLKVTGIILGGLGEFARVAAPDGKSYTLNIGTLVGPHEGEVVTITDNAVIVKEIIRYESGKVEEVETPLYLNPIDEEEKS